MDEYLFVWMVCSWCITLNFAAAGNCGTPLFCNIWSSVPHLENSNSSYHGCHLDISRSFTHLGTFLSKEDYSDTVNAFVKSCHISYLCKCWAFLLLATLLLFCPMAYLMIQILDRFFFLMLAVTVYWPSHAWLEQTILIISWSLLCYIILFLCFPK